MYINVDVLVIDDFGDEYKNEFIRDSITLAILNGRARNNLITIFTSAFNFNEISDMYSINVEGRARSRQLKNVLEDYAEKPIDISTINPYR